MLNTNMNIWLKFPCILILNLNGLLCTLQMVEIVPSALVLFILRKLPPRRVS